LGVIGDHMKGHAVTPDRVEDPNLSAIPADDPDIARLTATTGIEDGPVEEEPIRNDLQDRSFGLGQIGITRRQLFDRA
jgi:hypothetical protein